MLYMKEVEELGINFRVHYTAWENSIDIQAVYVEGDILELLFHSDIPIYDALCATIRKLHKVDLQQEADDIAVDRFRDFKEALEYYAYNGKNEP